MEDDMQINLFQTTNVHQLIPGYRIMDINSKVFITQGKEKEEAMVPSMEYLKFLEEKLKGKKFFGGDTIRFVDLALAWLANLISILEEIVGLKVGDGEKFPLCLHGPKILQMLQSLKEVRNTEIGKKTPENNESEVDSDEYTGYQKIQHSLEMKNYNT
ncbi:hypothetical protein VitviT2T_022832 [Vitis vinifera]|uniref:Glutathione S-transferase C-terminal domain-containing protein n=1 Tax=Vitis vinifera TaxID=29760 RepID=A0ABY9DE03_VITVI|nr:hypothetical protein VitviT2T_022832 [Vitis vinifera]